MLKWKTICCNNYTGVSFTTACLRRTPEKFMGLAGAYIQRRLVHSYMQRVEPDSEVYIYADKCFRNNPVSEDKLKDYCKEKAAHLLEYSGKSSTDDIAEHLKKIDASVCNLVRTNSDENRYQSSRHRQQLLHRFHRQAFPRICNAASRQGHRKYQCQSSIVRRSYRDDSRR